MIYKGEVPEENRENNENIRFMTDFLQMFL